MSQWEVIANLDTAAVPILDSVGLLALVNSVGANDIQDFRIPGDPNQSNGFPQTYRFKMPYAGWVLGYSFYGTCSPALQIGAYVTKKDLQGNYTDVLHVDPNSQLATDLSEGITYFTSTPPRYEAGELVAMKINTGPTSGSVDMAGYIHLQYDPNSVSQVASLQAPGAAAPLPPQPTPEADVAIIDLGKFYSKDGEAPTSNSQLKDAYIDNIDGTTLVNVNNSRFAPFNGQVTSAAICLQASVNCDTHVIIHTQGGDIGPLSIAAGSAHAELTVNPPVSVNQGGYFYAEFSSDNASTGVPVTMSAQVTFTPV